MRLKLTLIASIILTSCATLFGPKYDWTTVKAAEDEKHLTN